MMFKLENREVFARVVSQAIEGAERNLGLDLARKKAAVGAISKAVIRIKEQGEFMHFEPAADRLLIWSQTSNLVYTLGPDGRHGCLAELNNTICWHRAAKRLLQLYHAAMLEPAASTAQGGPIKSPGSMPYMQPADTRGREKIGGVWI